MSFLRFFTGILLISAIGNCEEDGHSHGDSLKVFENILDHLNTTLVSTDGHRLISRANLEKLLQDLNFKKCTTGENSSSCNLVSTYAFDFILIKFIYVDKMI